jgi:ATP-dependent Lon protease
MKKETSIATTKKTIIRVLPLKDFVFFPHMVAPLIIGRENTIEVVQDAVAADEIVFLATQKDPTVDDVTAKDLFRVGVTAKVLQSIKLPNNLYKILVEGINRAKVKRYFLGEKYLNASLNILEDEKIKGDHFEAKARLIASKFKEYVKWNEEIPDEILFAMDQLETPFMMADFVAANLSIKPKEKQKILEMDHIEKRLDHLHKVLNKENRLLSIKSDLEEKVREHSVKNQRTFYLQEQLQVIREELGEKDDYDADISKLETKIEKAKMSKEAESKALEELKRLENTAPMSPEYTVIQTYMETLLALPWYKRTKDRQSIPDAEIILDEDHYGLKKPKKRILEYIAVLQRVKKMSGPILCLSGPPGVGKTSLGKSIARALGREFTRISLGGINDEAEIRGHRKTYIGSMPGKIIQGLKKTGVVNPVFLLDEIDKLDSDFRGDPSSALLEVLDPEQNNTFIDHYLEVEYDLSEVMFIVTANNPNDISDALLDRMEVIELPGYLDHEKKEISCRHLIPKQFKANGLTAKEMNIENEALVKIITDYTMEAGVRNLEREISKICRAAVVELNRVSRKRKINVTRKNLPKYLGQAKFETNGLYKGNETGIAIGMAWTPYGGDLLRVEVNLLPGKDKLTLTGKLGEVMQESAVIALAYIRSKYRTFKIKKDFPETNEIHIHLPEGAIPKDGPSAGITLTTAVLSALKKQPFPNKTAMSGEITLRGNVLAVGGLNEKLLAAKRNGFKKIMIPAENKKDIKEMDKELLEGMELVFVKNYIDVYKHIFG